MEFFHCPHCRVINGYTGPFYLEQIKQGKSPDCDYCDRTMVAGKLPEMKEANDNAL